MYFCGNFHCSKTDEPDTALGVYLVMHFTSEADLLYRLHFLSGAAKKKKGVYWLSAFGAEFCTFFSYANVSTKNHFIDITSEYAS